MQNSRKNGHTNLLANKARQIHGRLLKSSFTNERVMELPLFYTLYLDCDLLKQCCPLAPFHKSASTSCGTAQQQQQLVFVRARDRAQHGGAGSPRRLRRRRRLPAAPKTQLISRSCLRESENGALHFFEDSKERQRRYHLEQS